MRVADIDSHTHTDSERGPFVLSSRPGKCSEPVEGRFGLGSSDGGLDVRMTPPFTSIFLCVDISRRHVWCNMEETLGTEGGVGVWSAVVRRPRKC